MSDELREALTHNERVAIENAVDLCLQKNWHYEASVIRSLTVLPPAITAAQRAALDYILDVADREVTERRWECSNVDADELAEHVATVRALATGSEAEPES